MLTTKEAMLLYAVTDRSWVGEKTLYQQVEEALKGGATCIQLREKHLGDKDFLNEALEMKELCKKYGVPFIINDNVDVALKCDSDGVHVGQSDMKAGNVRKLLGKDKIIGVSARTLEEALEAERAGADYLGVGAVFSTSTKLDAVDVPHEVLKEICKRVSIPVVAIGGINKDNILELKGTGCSGVALVSAIFSKKDITKECEELRKLSLEMVK